jgi:glycosyltransferase involved in cell wall biosynthesis
MPPRIAYFPDSFHEVNGVAHTSRNFAAYAERRGLPFLCVRAGSRPEALVQQQEQWSLELRRSRFSVQIEQDLWFDPRFLRHRAVISHALRSFQPDVIHITGPSELGIFGAYFAWKLKVPLVASWHTNLHEYAARRMGWLTRHIGAAGEVVEAKVEAFVLDATSRFYRLAKVVYAPNLELCALLERTTGRACHLMQRGVDTEHFTPARRRRTDTDLVLGYVGRLSVEKNVALLPRVDADLRARGIAARWLIVGHGSEEAMLRQALPEADIVGVLRGEALADAYASMDLLVFPSHTDTFGNVVLEALASGVPAIVTPDGGPAHIVRDGVTGRVVADHDFAAAVAACVAHAEMFASMRAASREYAMGCSWDAVFDRVVAEYPIVR